ncbi:MAG: FtsW/RodA/SpoVE family cell cycle protein [Kiritimatiellia bacterium]
MKADWVLIGAFAALTGLGVVVQTRLAGTIPSGLVGPLVVGVVAAFVCAGGWIGRALRGRGPWIAWGLACALMAALLVFGRRYRGGLYLPGRLNPSELVKLCVVVFTAGWLTRGKCAPPPRTVLACGGLFCVVGAGIALAGDFGLLAQLALTFAAMLFAASWGWGLAAGAVIGVGFACAAAHPIGHLATRFAVWRDPLADVTGAGWQTLQGLAAVVSGGVRGLGFGLGDVDAVPIVSSDFVYAALAEELGLVGCLAVLALWGVVFVRGLLAAARCAAAGAFGEALLATGIVASLAVQVVLNVAGVLNALPMTGIPLPLISHGGSSLVVTLAFGGLLCGVARCGAAPRKRKRSKPQTGDAVV